MTYQSTAHPAHSVSPLEGLRRAGAGLRRFFAGIGHGIMMGSTAHRRFEQVQILQAKSDEELAAMGIKRDDIVHHVFKDLYYI
ncbi:MAG TPA: hypothetical protein DC031_17855 [Sulfitobacter sp.]|jgi:uncharacterized protein YjiS (DUF1127 family)|uniref:hypothetical protein n=1 Tax=Sulfitobacter dubius TaxID=218673 RepID=UPI0008E787C9|nr:hypothetical protein [Sulfitobacter dubius]MBM05482.1 hypothetical protein [Sulfitobacter sp.]SFG53387.1 hypothetical protein SAMN04488039_1011151 [Sulfitobacter dubius]HBB85077.1 hypothetical protein [Sulfitobacter sp.]